jgi:hypothetical protein
MQLADEHEYAACVHRSIAYYRTGGSLRLACRARGLPDPGIVASCILCTQLLF